MFSVRGRLLFSAKLADVTKPVTCVTQCDVWCGCVTGDVTPDTVTIWQYSWRDRGSVLGSSGAWFKCSLQRCLTEAFVVLLTQVTLFKICHSMLSTQWQDHTICLKLVDTFFQNLNLPPIGWHSCQLSVSLPALPPAQASTLDMLSSYMDHTIVRHKFSLTFHTKN